MAASDRSTALPLLTSALNQRYPGSVLITEFLTYQDGQYAIRAVVQRDAVILSTGMAANADIEVAEDRAKIRAMQALDLSSMDNIDDVESMAASSAPKSLPKPIAKTGQPIKRRTDYGDGDRPLTVANPSPLASVETETHCSETSPDLSGNAHQPPGLEPLDSPSDATVHVPSPAQTSSTPTPSPSLEPKTTTSAAAGIMNLQDPIAKTTVEMQRLGWDVPQGRQALLERYGKRSRHELTDDEVLDFLRYLEQHP